MDIRKYLSRKRCHKDVTDSESESLEESIAVDETTTTASEPSPSLSKAAKRKLTKVASHTDQNGKRSIPGYIVLILSMECSVKCAKSGENLLQQVVLGLVEALQTGIMLQSSLKITLNQNGIKMQLQQLEWQNNLVC